MDGFVQGFNVLLKGHMIKYKSMQPQEICLDFIVIGFVILSKVCPKWVSQVVVTGIEFFVFREYDFSS